MHIGYTICIGRQNALPSQKCANSQDEAQSQLSILPVLFGAGACFAGPSQDAGVGIQHPHVAETARQHVLGNCLTLVATEQFAPTARKHGPYGGLSVDIAATVGLPEAVPTVVGKRGTVAAVAGVGISIPSSASRTKEPG